MILTSDRAALRPRFHVDEIALSRLQAAGVRSPEGGSKRVFIVSALATRQDRCKSIFLP